MIGPAYARRFPSRVLSLGLWSTAAFRTTEDSAKVKAVVAAMREKGLRAVLDTLTARWFTDAFAAERPEVIEWRKKQVMNTPIEVFLNVFDIYADTEMAPWLHEITAAAMVLTGELDGACSPKRYFKSPFQFARTIPRALPHLRQMGIVFFTICRHP